MVDVFVSYSSEDREQASAVAALLEDHGYSVWWDRELAAGQEYHEVIGRMLQECRLAVVIWTASSIKSRWVLGEAETAASVQKLIPLRADHLPADHVPIAFRVLHTIALSDHKGLLDAVRSQLATEPKRVTAWHLFRRRAQRRLDALKRWATVRFAISAAVIVVLAGYFLLMLIDWRQIRDSLEANDFERHLARFPIGPFAGQARAKLAGMSDWEKIKASTNISDIQDFLQKYPGSLYEQFARLRLVRLDAIRSGRYTPVLRDSLHRAIDGKELEALNCDQLWTARNEIFYILGYCFVSDAGINTFHTGADCPYAACKTIQKINSIVTDEIVTGVQRANIDAINKLEKKNGCHIAPVGGACANDKLPSRTQ
jgi:hypothetical protein